MNIGRLTFCAMVLATFLPCLTNAAVPAHYMLGIKMNAVGCLLKGGGLEHCGEGHAVHVTGLYPEPLSASCQTQQLAKLSPIQAGLASRLMPDVVQRQQLWYKVGGCFANDASAYFRSLGHYAEQLKLPHFIASPKHMAMNASVMRNALIQSNRSLSVDAIMLDCYAYDRSYFLEQIKICYNRTGNYSACPSSVRSSCPKQFHIKGFS